jgi:hypothetical protein
VNISLPNAKEKGKARRTTAGAFAYFIAACRIRPIGHDEAGGATGRNLSRVYRSGRSSPETRITGEMVKVKNEEKGFTDQ